MVEAATALRSNGVTIEIFAAEEIAAWASQDLWARTFVLRATGGSEPATLITFDEWQRQAHFQNP